MALNANDRSIAAITMAGHALGGFVLGGFYRTAFFVMIAAFAGVGGLFAGALLVGSGLFVATDNAHEANTND
ncbi:hypothetical protein [Natrinema sp. CBA1119]|uniref:hypothetical protein n=1 Tax=Natrinema sp. CBA1119 TaxID=1608465 RepID=UPI0020D27810|nr:hypothetical protein [Natrinema sp. CBA1119]